MERPFDVTVVHHAGRSIAVAVAAMIRSRTTASPTPTLRPHPSVYVVMKVNTQRNIYRVPV